MPCNHLGTFGECAEADAVQHTNLHGNAWPLLCMTIPHEFRLTYTPAVGLKPHPLRGHQLLGCFSHAEVTGVLPAGG